MYTHMATPHRKVDPRQPFQMHDLLTDARYSKHGTKSYAELNPQSAPADILSVRLRLGRERDFDYFL
jgi:starch synthase (maltosyl-transferring)